MGNKKSNAPGFGSGNGKLKAPKIGGKLGERTILAPYPKLKKNER